MLFVVSERKFIKEIGDLYSKFKDKRQEYTGDDYKKLLFDGNKITYRKFIKIHNFKCQVPLPIPKCDCIFKNLSNALNKDTLEEKLKSMGKLKGFRLSLASTILHFFNPDKYAIIDSNVIEGMKELGWETRTQMKINEGTITFYNSYLNNILRVVKDGKVQSIAEDYDIPILRLVEASLFALGKDWEGD